MTSEDVYVTGLDWVRGTEEPLDTFSRPIATISWDEVALDNRAAFDEDLRMAGLSKESVSEALAVRDAGLAEMAEAIERLEPYKNIKFRTSPPEYIAAKEFYNAKRKSALQKLGDWWNQRVTTVEAVEPLSVRVPLFVLGAPSAPGCKAEWTNEIVSGFSKGWTLTLAGSGFASDAGSTYITSANFEASSGETKLIFCDIALQLEDVAIHQLNKPPVRQWRIDLTKVGDGTVWPGLLLLDPDAIPPSGDFVRKYPLAGDTSGSLATYKEKYSRKTKLKVNVGLKVKGVELGLSAASDFGSDIEIKYSLKSGIDYELLYASDCDGYLFGATP